MWMDFVPILCNLFTTILQLVWWIYSFIFHLSIWKMDFKYPYLLQLIYNYFMIDVNLVSYNVWHHSIVTLQKITIGQKVNDLLHLMFTSQLKEIKKILNILLNGSQGEHKNAYCDTETWMWMSQPHFEGNVRSPLTFSKMGLGSPSGLSKI